MKTYSAKPVDVKRSWLVIDAEGVVLGRLAATVASILRGKHKPTYTPHMDLGDHVVIVNAGKIALTGSKLLQKRFYWHTGFPGGIKYRTAAQTLSSAHPERLVLKAVERMVPKGPLGRAQLKKLHVYADVEHPHTAQKPQVLNFAARNRKNKRTIHA